MLDRIYLLFAPAISEKPLTNFYPYIGYKRFSFSGSTVKERISNGIVRPTMNR